MTATALTATIAGTIYPVLNKSYTLSDKVDQRSTVTLTIYDANGTYSFQYGQTITITDTLEGVKFSGHVHKPSGVKYEASAGIAYTIDCIDKCALAGWRTTNRSYVNQYAGVIAAGIVNDVLAAEGITANYALREDNSQTDFGQGTLASTVATSNLGGDLELALAGSQVTIVEQSTASFATGTLNNVVAANNSLSPSTTASIKMVCTQSVPGGGNSYAYVKIWQPSGTFTVLSGRFFAYDIWIDGSSPQCKFGVDIAFTDGTFVRDHATFNDVQNIPPHPANDLPGVAKDQWYHREFYIDNFAGKNIAYLSVACEGDTVGTYTAYFKNINYENNDHSLNQAFFASSFNVNPPQQMQMNGYSSAQLSIVNTIDTSSAYRISQSYNIDAVKIVKNSFISWKTYMPPNTVVAIFYSIDGGSSFQQCTNNAPLPNLPAGISVAGKSIIFYEEFYALSGANPEQPNFTLDSSGLPTVATYLGLIFLECVLNSSYTSSKTDVLFSTASSWSGGTFSNTVGNGGALNLIGAIRDFDDGSDVNQGLYGGGASGFLQQSCNQKAMSVTVDTADQAISRMDFAGTFASGIIDVDIYIDNANAKIGVTYNTTNWSNYDANYAYAVEVSLTTIALQRGSNSSASSNGTRTQLGTASLTLSSGNWHHLKVVFSAGSHAIYLDDIQMITSSDATYSGAGYIGLRISNSTGANYTAQWDNFGIMKALSGTYVSPVTSLTSAATYGNSVVWWRDVSTNPSLVALSVEAKIGSGSYAAVTNGGTIPGLTVGQSLSSVTVTFRVTLTTTTASAMPGMIYFNAYILGQFSSSGTRISPVLSLANALIAGSTVVNWAAITPPNTSIAVATSPDGSTWTSVSNGGAIAGIITQPAPTLDTFASDDHTSYTHLQRTGGSTGAWTWDTTHSRLSVTGGANDMQLWTAISVKDIDIVLDLDQADRCGLVWRQVDAGNFYELDIYDGSSSAGLTNVMQLFKVMTSVTPLTVYGSSVADATLTNACDMASTTGGTETLRTSTTSGSGNFIEVLSQGGTTPCFSSLQSPTGKGWVSHPGSGTFAGGNWSASVTLSGAWGAGTINAIIRFYKYSGGTYTSIGSITGPNMASTATKTTWSFSATGMPATTFGSSDLLYIDLWIDDSGGAGGDNPVVYESTSSSSGVVSDMQVVTSGLLSASPTKTQLGSNQPITLPRGTPKRVRVTMIGTSITILFEGVSVFSTTDNSLSSAGKAGIIEVSGIGRFYNLRLQPQGQSLSGINSCTKVTVTSTDPTVTPQLTDLVLCALHPNIGLGSLVPTVDYLHTYLSDNLDDLAKKSSTYFWNIDQNSNFIFSDRYAIPAPFVLNSNDQKVLLDGPPSVDYVGDLYHNRHTCTGVNATALFSENKIGDGNTTSWALGNTVAATPTISLNGQLKTVGQKGIDTGKDFYYQLNNNSIDQDSSGTVLQQTDTLNISYTGNYITTITVDNTGPFAGTTSIAQFAAIIGGTGIIEVVEDVSSLNLDITSATDHATGLLTRNGVIGRTLTFKTWRSNPSLAIGQFLAVFFPEHALNDALMLISQIDTTQDLTVDPASGSPTHIYYQTVTALEGPNMGTGWKLLASAFQ